MPGYRVRWLCCALLTALVVAAVAPAAQGQLQAVRLEVNPQSVGLDGQVRPGTWTPMRVMLENQGADNRAVVCRWLLHDRDGDTVAYERKATLNPQRKEPMWLYGAVPMHSDRRWTVEVLDAKSGQLLASRQVRPRKFVPAQDAMIGICSNSDLGLGPYTSQATRHEKLDLITGMSLARLPDRWYGLAALKALVWTRQGTSPSAPTVTGAMLEALRNWVRRGGQLIISLPAINEPWTGSSLANMLPVGKNDFQRVRQPPPTVLGPIRTATVSPIQMIVFDVSAHPHVTVLARDDQGRAMIVAKRYGFGRVTLIGVDLTDPTVRHMGLPFGKYRIWNQIFDWQSPVLSEATVQSEIQANEMSRPSSRPTIELDRFIPALIAMRNTAAPALLAAIVLFGFYWLLAGPLGFALLKRQHLVRFAWVGFLAVVVLFTAIAWGGAYFLQPGSAYISHFTVIDADNESSSVHVHSWLSLFVPRFGRAAVAVAPGHPGAANTLASPGLFASQNRSGFIDPQTYVVDAGAPNHADIPMRATAKQLTIDYFGPLDARSKGLKHRWAFPTGSIRIDNFWPVGKLSHNLPGTLTDVLVVYCPGNGAQPWVWHAGSWAPHQDLDLSKRGNVERLVVRPNRFAKIRQWDREGLLGQLIGLKTGVRFSNLNALVRQAAGNNIVQAVEMLSFYGALPPPNFRDTSFSTQPTTYLRSIGRWLDVTDLIGGRRVIIVGQLKDSPLPVPLTVDGRHVPASGWTVVHWVYDL